MALGAVFAFVTFASLAATIQVTRVSIRFSGVQSDGLSRRFNISHNGRFVSFMSDGTNLVADDTNELNDLVAHDRTTGETKRLSLTASGAQYNANSYRPLGDERRSRGRVLHRDRRRIRAHPRERFPRRVAFVAGAARQREMPGRE